MIQSRRPVFVVLDTPDSASAPASKKGRLPTHGTSSIPFPRAPREHLVTPHTADVALPENFLYRIGTNARRPSSVKAINTFGETISLSELIVPS